MPRTRFDDVHCSVAQAAEVVGDPWTLLILREAFLGATRFGQFERALGIAKNILTQRLQHLVDHEVLKRESIDPDGRRMEYRLTPRGRDLLTVLTAMREWSDRWVYGKGNEPLVMRDRRTGRRVPPLRIRDGEGEPIAGQNLRMEPGPGADEPTRRRFERGRRADRPGV